MSKQNKLVQNLLKNTKYADQTALLDDSIVLKPGFNVPTHVPMLNLALSGHIDKGLTAGVTVFAGASKSFKTLFGLLLARSYMKKYKDSAMLFYDNEFGATPAYFKMLGVDTSRVVHTYVHNMEELKFDLVNQLDKINRGDKVFIFVDSIGNLASKKELDDALDSKSVADMTRAKSIKSLFRMVTPLFNSKDLPGVFINHTYKETGMFAKTVVSGGTGVMYSADTIFVVGKSQNKKAGGPLEGWDFKLKAEKSRYVKEQSIFPVQVNYSSGINTFSGLLEVGEELGYIEKVGRGRYKRMKMVDMATGELIEDSKSYLKKETNAPDFWKTLFESSDFADALHNAYALQSSDLINDNYFDEEEENEGDE